jgi:hypothetical protein
MFRYPVTVKLIKSYSNSYELLSRSYSIFSTSNIYTFALRIMIQNKAVRCFGEFKGERDENAFRLKAI